MRPEAGEIYGARNAHFWENWGASGTIEPLPSETDNLQQQEAAEYGRQPHEDGDDYHDGNY